MICTDTLWSTVVSEAISFRPLYFAASLPPWSEIQRKEA